ncbi:cation transporter [Criibacterium bergeronii]|uniref:Heavy-metal-associated domain-containing protein n=1 Tax=Criibacterium bergeronii TaxID=1871336 RepID=A0A371IIU8_9FIRM|nr:heavy metal-associated domain-containing protein [Criibacterium bergeronii]RDY20393.1 heavy-metal-associated domain-containing protein [Criibacterium bergeronii]TRW25053.1 heavy-metal-associated domain-containing protein [Criibacterium bergeronii]
MKKSYKINVDCANCANLMENEISKLTGINSATVNFMTQKIKLDIQDGVDVEEIIAKVTDICRDIEPECVISKC